MENQLNGKLNRYKTGMNKKASMKKTTYTPYSADNDEIDFGQQLRVIWTNKYKILAALLAGGILGAAFSLASTPQYRDRRHAGN